MSTNPLMKPSGAKLVLIVSALAVAVAGAGTYAYVLTSGAGTSKTTAATSEVVAEDKKSAVGALGKLEPVGEVYKIAPPAVGFSSRVLQLRVKEGDRVRKGQVIAVMDTAETLQATGMQAEAQVREAQVRLARAKASQVSDVNAQGSSALAQGAEVDQAQARLAAAAADYEAALAGESAAIAAMEKAEAERSKAEIDLKRYDALRKEGAIAEAQLDSWKLTFVQKDKEFQQRQRELVAARKVVAQRLAAGNQAKQAIAAAAARAREAGFRLDSMKTTKTTGIAEAEAQLAVAMANLRKAEVDFQNSLVKSPIDGQVLKIHAKNAEPVSTDNGIMEIGQTSQMYARAEVDENFIGKVQVGQKATIKSDAFEGEVTGTVESIGSQIRKNSVTSSDPADQQDTRVVEVRIRLDDSAKVSRFTNLQVKVAIQTGEG
ncbi:MAG: HlyD family efflux transporter periplasmic adaptor subunit [Synechococcales bacterium]|nr:HlyD family efflux transporter periplasmic adaptor subunit [Synechococcales bacterium]